MYRLYSAPRTGRPIPVVDTARALIAHAVLAVGLLAALLLRGG